MIMVSSEIQTIISDFSDISNRLARLDVPAYSQAFKIFKAQISISQAAGYLSRLLIELTNENLSNSHSFTSSCPDDDDNVPF